MGVVRLHLKLPDLTDQTCEKKVEFLHEVYLSLFCKSRTDVTGKRSNALLLALVRWWKWLSLPFVGRVWKR